MNRCLASLFLLSAFSLPLCVAPACRANRILWPQRGSRRPRRRRRAKLCGDPSHQAISIWARPTAGSTRAATPAASLAAAGQALAEGRLILDNIVVDESGSEDPLCGGAGSSTIRRRHLYQPRCGKDLEESRYGRPVGSCACAGPFESEDAGRGHTPRASFAARTAAHWDQISPADSTELHEVESIAIDPKDPETIYAGTWHLPWKTTDGGENWHNIKQGVIDDSDVFSIIIDPNRPTTVYTSACSGIYKSDNGGEHFHKIQGIPSTARRTRVLMQDPVDLSIVYAGTTEGLYKTTFGGTNLARA